MIFNVNNSDCKQFSAGGRSGARLQCCQDQALCVYPPSLKMFNTSQATENGELASGNIKNQLITDVLQSMAQLRRYILTEHPAMLPETAPCLVQAETEIFQISQMML